MDQEDLVGIDIPGHVVKITKKMAANGHPCTSSGSALVPGAGTRSGIARSSLISGETGAGGKTTTSLMI